MLLWIVRQAVLKSSDGGVGLSLPPPDRPRLLVSLERLGRLAGGPEHNADVVMAGRQFALDCGESGVGLGQLSLDRQSLLVRLERFGSAGRLYSGGRRPCSG